MLLAEAYGLKARGEAMLAAFDRNVALAANDTDGMPKSDMVITLAKLWCDGWRCVLMAEPTLRAAGQRPRRIARNRGA